MVRVQREKENPNYPRQRLFERLVLKAVREKHERLELEERKKEIQQIHQKVTNKYKVENKKATLSRLNITKERLQLSSHNLTQFRLESSQDDLITFNLMTGHSVAKSGFSLAFHSVLFVTRHIKTNISKFQFDLDVKCLLMSPWLGRLGDYYHTMTLNLIYHFLHRRFIRVRVFQNEIVHYNTVNYQYSGNSSGLQRFAHVLNDFCDASNALE